MTLLQIISEAQAAATHLAKDKVVTIPGKYSHSYTTREAAADFIREHIVSKGVAVSTDFELMALNPVGEKGQTMAVVKSIVTLAYGDERVTWTGVGQGLDNSDKGIGKAVTSGLRVLLVNNLLGTDGTPDPEEENAEVVVVPSTRSRASSLAESSDSAIAGIALKTRLGAAAKTLGLVSSDKTQTREQIAAHFDVPESALDDVTELPALVAIAEKQVRDRDREDVPDDFLERAAEDWS